MQFRRQVLRGLPVVALVCGVLPVATPGQSLAADPTLTTLVSFCALANCADGQGQTAGLIADAKGNLFGTTNQGGAHAVKTTAGALAGFGGDFWRLCAIKFMAGIIKRPYPPASISLL